MAFPLGKCKAKEQDQNVYYPQHSKENPGVYTVRNRELGFSSGDIYVYIHTGKYFRGRHTPEHAQCEVYIPGIAQFKVMEYMFKG